MLQTLPVYYDSQGCPPCVAGGVLAIKLHEPRYKLLAYRAWERQRLFLHTRVKPTRGAVATLMEVQQVVMPPDQPTTLTSVGKFEVVLGETWIQAGTGGLYFSQVSADPVPPVLTRREGHSIQMCNEMNSC